MADKNKHSQDPADQYHTRPPVLGRWEGFRMFLWNSEKSQFLGRTAGSWGKILFFYLCFYIGLVGYFSAMMTVFYQTLDMKAPKWQLDSSLIGNNPGLGFRPMPPEENVESTLIWYKGSDNNYEYWTEELDKFLEVYKQPGSAPGSGNVVQCNFNTKPPAGKVCAVNVDNFDPCTKANHYGYHKHSPCIFLKLNKIFNWVPDIYKDNASLPGNMPPDLKEYIGEHPDELNTVWVSCEGENPADVENIGAISYIPNRGFAGYYFPFMNQDGYLSPLLAIHFQRPAKGVLINIECKAWAHNINHDRHERRGSVHFELMID